MINCYFYGLPKCMKRTDIIVPFTILDKVIEVLSILAVLYITALLVFNYADLPNRIPTHYNFEGVPDGWGSKSTVIVVWVVAIFVYIGMTILSRYPGLYNFPVEITEQNISIQYKLAIKLVRTLKLALVVTFMLIMYSSLQVEASQQELIFGPYFFLIVFGITFMPIVYYFVQARKFR